LGSEVAAILSPLKKVEGGEGVTAGLGVVDFVCVVLFGKTLSVCCPLNGVFEMLPIQEARIKTCTNKISENFLIYDHTAKTTRPKWSSFYPPQKGDLLI
jgi:hypothetical protein